jgi:hypothetical protein
LVFLSIGVGSANYFCRVRNNVLLLLIAASFLHSQAFISYLRSSPLFFSQISKQRNWC